MLITKIINKLIMLVIVSLFIVVPFTQIKACPHYDKEGNMYFLFYDDDNYEISILLYPKDYHSHLFFYNFDNDKLYEQYEIYIYQEEDFYNVGEFDPLTGDLIESEKEITVKNLDNLELFSDNYKLNVPVKKTYIEGQNNLTKDIFSIFYNLRVTEFNNPLYKSEYQAIKQVFKELPVDYIGAEILSIDTFMETQYRNWTKDEIIINEFIEPIEITVNLDEVDMKTLLIDDLVAVRINTHDDNNFSLSEITGIYDEINQSFTFEAMEIGMYSIVVKTGNINNQEKVTVVIEKEEALFGNDPNSQLENSKKTKIIVTVSMIALIILLFVSKKLVK